jgi:hypothetical protein
MRWAPYVLGRLRSWHADGIVFDREPARRDGRPRSRGIRLSRSLGAVHVSAGERPLGRAGAPADHFTERTGEHLELRLAFQRVVGDADITFPQLNLETDSGTNSVFLSQGPNGNSFAARSDYVDGGPAGGKDVLVGDAGSLPPQFTPFRLVIEGTSVRLFVDEQGPTDQAFVGCAPTGATVIASASNDVFRALSVDSQNVYWWDTQQGQLNACPVGGCTAPAVLTTRPLSYSPNPAFIAADSKASLYWVGVLEERRFSEVLAWLTATSA